MALDPTTSGYIDPVYGWVPFSPAVAPPAGAPPAAAAPPATDPTAGAPPGPLAGAAPAGPLSGLAGLFGPATGGFADFLNSGVAAGVGGALLAGHGLPTYLGTQVPQIAANAQRRAAVNAWLKSQSGLNLSPEEQNLLQSDPQLAENIATYRLTPHPLVVVPPGSSLANPMTGQFVGGGPHRGDGSAYDLENANKAYNYQFGEGSNRAIDAPDPQWWYKNAWPTFGQAGDANTGVGAGAGAGGAAAAPGGGSAASAAPPAAAAPANTMGTVQITPQGVITSQPAAQPAAGTDQPAAAGPPKRAMTEQDTVRYDRIIRAVTAPYLDLPGYKLVANGGAYLSRIEQAAKIPGSISDQDLLDSVTKLNNAGGQVTDAQVNLVLKGQSFADKASVWTNQLAKGGVLSDDQRKQLYDVAHAVYAGYQKMYQPIYNEVKQRLAAQGVPASYGGLPDLNSLSQAAGVAGGSDNSGGGGGGATIQEGQTATNQATGHRIMNRGGQLIDLTTGQPLQQ